jgi:CheY-like chemotaxis protein
MRLDFDTNVTALPLAEKTSLDDQNINAASEVEMLLSQGTEAARAGDRRFARTLLIQATEVDPKCEDAWMWLASISEYPEELLVFLNRVLEINPGNVRASEWRVATHALLSKTFSQRALATYEDGSNDLASRFADQAISLDATSVEPWALKAKYADNEEVQAALWQRVTELDPENVEAAAALGEIERRRVESLFAAAKIAMENDDRSEAVSLLDEYIAEVPGNIDALVMKAELADSDEEAQELWSNVQAIDPDNSAAADAKNDIERRRIYSLLDKAKAAVEQGDRVEALSLLDQFLAANPDDVEALVMTAHLADSDESAVECWNRVLEIDPSSAEAADALVDLQSSKLESMFDAARASARSGDTITAITAVKGILEAHPGNVEAWMMLSHLSPTMEDKLEALKQVLVIEPDNAAARAGYEYMSAAVASLSPDTAVDVADAVEVVEQEIQAAPPEEVDSAETVEMHAEYSSVTEVEVSEPAELPSYQFEEPEATPTHEMETAEYSLRGASVPAADQVLAAEIEEHVEETVVPGFDCPFCSFENENMAFECSNCHANLSLSDVESVLNNAKVDSAIVQNAVTRLEAEWNIRDLTEAEMTAIGVGYLNLKNYDEGCKYLQEASYINPNNVILAGHINTIMIRLDEMRRQNEIHDAMPKGKTILVVDDSPTVRKLISGKLEKSGHRVVCAVDGVDAMEKLAEVTPDLVLLDITMPRMDGYEVCKQIRSSSEGKELPVVMISGKDGFFDKVRGRMAGTTGYITKPFGPETLMKALETYLIPE